MELRERNKRVWHFLFAAQLQKMLGGDPEVVAELADELMLIRYRARFGTHRKILERAKRLVDDATTINVDGTLVTISKGAESIEVPIDQHR